MNSDLHSMLKCRVPDFAGERLLPFSRPDLGKTVTDGLHLDATSVDLSRVKGVTHPAYQGHTWGELIGSLADGSDGRLKRLRKRLQQLESDPSYYTSRTFKPGWSFFKLGDRLFVEGGVHRTVIARFFLELNGMPPTVHGVGLTVLHPVAGLAEEFEGSLSGRSGYLQRLWDFFASAKRKDA